jgi:sugar-specific transcriptional regulator TrmB
MIYKAKRLNHIMDKKILLGLGLTNWEIQTYLALLELGSTTTGPLVKKAEVPHSKIYSVLESLNKKGLANHIIKGKIKYFQAVEPESLLSIIKDKERELKTLLPELNKLKNSSKNKQNVEIYEGMKAMTSFMINLIENSKENEEWMSFSIGEDELLEKAQTFWDKIGILRYEKKLNVKVMDNIDYKEKLKNIYKDRWEHVKKIIRFSKNIFPATTIIFKDKIIILNFLSEPETAVVISSKDLINYYQNFYLKEWERAKP